jgi:hypothetical protein
VLLQHFIDFIVFNQLRYVTFLMCILTTLYSPINVDHNNFLESLLIPIMRITVGHIDFQPTQKF